MLLRLLLLGTLLGLAAPAWGGELERSFAVGEEGRLVIDLEFGSVLVERHDGEEVQIAASASGVGASSIHFDARAEGRDVYFAGAAEPWLRWLRATPGVRVRARVPRRFVVRVVAPTRVEVSDSSFRVSGLSRQGE